MKFAALAGVLSWVTFTPLAHSFDHDYGEYGRVLTRFVRSGLVDYEALGADPGGLDAYLDDTAGVSGEEFAGWSAPQQIAFLVNLYNAATLHLILDHYPVDGIKDIGGFFRSPWKLEVVRLFGTRETLDHVEHEILRERYDEPRIHFALVCAAMGCPPLREEPYVASRLDEQLDDQGRRFLRTVEKNRLDAERQILFLSPIFKWFREDFTGGGRTVAAFVKPYLPEEMTQRLDEERVRIRYTRYDWSLNRQPRGG